MGPPSTLNLGTDDSAGVDTGGPALAYYFAPIWAVPTESSYRGEVHYPVLVRNGGGQALLWRAPSIKSRQAAAAIRNRE